MPATTQSTCTSSGTCTYHYGSSTLTLTSVNGYTGSPLLTCTAVNPPAGAKIPSCFEYGLPVAVGAGQSVTEDLLLVPPGGPLPPEPATSSRLGGRAGTTLAFAGVLLFGFGVRRRARRLRLAVAVLASVTVLSGLTACAGSDNSMTPGTYTYQVTAQDSSAQATATTSFTVTIT